jgi:hypothetical protein
MSTVFLYLLLVCLAVSCKSLSYEQGYLNGNVKYPQAEE